jgi:maleylpyruvate isomerase
VLDGVTVGQQLQPYDSPQARADDIQAGAGRDTPTIAEDFHAATARLAQTVDGLAPELWSATVDLGRGGPTTAE